MSAHRFVFTVSDAPLLASKGRPDACEVQVAAVSDILGIKIKLDHSPWDEVHVSCINHVFLRRLLGIGLGLSITISLLLIR